MEDHSTIRSARARITRDLWYHEDTRRLEQWQHISTAAERVVTQIAARFLLKTPIVRKIVEATGLGRRSND